VISASRLRQSSQFFTPLAIGGWSAAAAVAPSLQTKLALATPLPFLAALTWLFRKPGRWIPVLFFALVLSPPLASGFGNSGAHPAPLIALIGLFVGIRFHRQWAPARDRLTLLLLLFLAVIFASTAFAAWYSGWQIAAGSLARVMLFGIGVYAFLWARSGPQSESVWSSLRWLYIFATAAALFACIDFYYQLPAPSGFGPQYVWLDSGVFRRAQGFFYEASTLGNFCAFFLTMILVSVFGRQTRFSIPAHAIAFTLFAAALIFSFSRGSAINVIVAGGAFLLLRGLPLRRMARLIVPALITLTVTASLLHFITPTFFDHYVTRVVASFELLDQSPDRVFSGRLAAWSTIGTFITTHPLDLIFGIGYKTLPYSTYAGNNVVADNTYLSLLIETGLIGLTVFGFLNAAILRTAWRAARSTRDTAAFFGAWFFCFWCGELVQMLSGDLITYWRVLPLYFWVLGVAAREASA